MKQKYISIIAVLLVAILMGIGIHYTQEFRFYNLESNDLFLYDGADILRKLQQVGGLSLLITSFLTQFMKTPLVGTCMVTVLYLCVAWVIWRILRKQAHGMVMAGFSLLPVAFLYLCLEHDYYRLQGHIAYLLMLFSLWGYLSIPSNRLMLRLAVGTVLVPLLYVTAGSVAVAFALSACWVECLDRGFKGTITLAYPVVAGAMAFFWVSTSKVDHWETVLTPLMYYNWPTTYFFPLYAWGMIPLLWMIAWGLSKFSLNVSARCFCVVSGVVLAFYLAGNIYGKVHSKNNYRFLQEQYWVEHEEWDALIETADRRQSTFYISYLNLALAKKGQLVQRFRQFNQQPYTKLMMYPHPIIKNGVSLQSDVYWAWGYIAAARQAAFDANLLTPGSCNPHHLKILVQTNLVLGAYQVAEKYIGWLEKTLFYRAWATDMRRFLHNPEAIRQDKLLGQMVASVPLTDKYIKYEGLGQDMEDILAVNPSQKVLSQFYEVYRWMEKEEKP